LIRRKRSMEQSEEFDDQLKGGNDEND